MVRVRRRAGAMVANAVDARNSTGGVLAIETSSDACSVAFRGADGASSEDHRDLPRGHHRVLLPMIDGLLGRHDTAPRDLEAIVLSAGPGSFTGLRIGASVAQALALAADCPIVAVSSLMVLAAAAGATEAPVIATQPARPGELYVGVYRHGDPGWVQALPDRVVGIAQLGRHLSEYAGESALVVGRGASALLEAAGGHSWRRGPHELPHAAVALVIGATLLRSGHGKDAAHVELNYVNDESAWRKA